MLGLIELIREIFFFTGFITTGSSFPKPLTAAQESKAIECMIAGDTNARDELIRHNLRLVAHVSKKFASSGFEQDDLISIGSIGLIKAVSTFDAKKGAQLATYAARCIQNEILMAVRANKKYKSDVLLSDAIGKDKEGNEITLVDVMGTLQDAVLDEVENKIQIKQLRLLVASCLNYRERIVIELRYGLQHNASLPQREVANLLGISRSYVSRIEKKAISKLQAMLKPAHQEGTYD